MCIACDDQRVRTSALTPNQTQTPAATKPCKKRRSRIRKVTFVNCDKEAKRHTPKQSLKTRHQPAAAVSAEIIATIPASSTLTREELSKVHWQPEDYAYFRGSARVIAEEVRKVSSSTQQKSRSYNSVLSRTLEVCHIVSQDKTQSDTNDNVNHQNDDPDTTMMCLPPRLFGALTDWTREGHSRRGIERYCVQSHEESRPMARRQAIEAVLVTQELLQQKGFQAGSFQVGDVELPSTLSNEEIVRQVSQEFTRCVCVFYISSLSSVFYSLLNSLTHVIFILFLCINRSSKLYALAMGHADAAAVGNLKTNNPT
jgi:hypothetical protein